MMKFEPIGKEMVGKIMSPRSSKSKNLVTKVFKARQMYHSERELINDSEVKVCFSLLKVFNI